MLTKEEIKKRLGEIRHELAKENHFIINDKRMKVLCRDLAKKEKEYQDIEIKQFEIRNEISILQEKQYKLRAKLNQLEEKQYAIQQDMNTLFREKNEYFKNSDKLKTEEESLLALTLIKG